MTHKIKADKATHFLRREDADAYAKLYEQFGRFRIIWNKRYKFWRVFAYEWGQHPYSTR